MNELQTIQADRLKQLHGEIMGAARMVMDKAIEAGGILQEVKASLPHGEFTEWVEQNAGFNIRTAQRYMKIYENRDVLKNDSVSLLTDAHKMLTAPMEQNKVGHNAIRKQQEHAAIEARECLLEARRQEVMQAGIQPERPWRVFSRVHNDIEEICIARGPNEEHRTLETADFVVLRGSFRNEVPRTTPTMEIIKHVHGMALDGSVVCTKLGVWGDYRIPNVSHGEHFAYSWGIEPTRVKDVKGSGWMKSGLEHGLPTDWFCEALLHSTAQEKEACEREATANRLRDLYKERDHIDKKIKRLEGV